MADFAEGLRKTVNWYLESKSETVPFHGVNPEARPEERTRPFSWIALVCLDPPLPDLLILKSETLEIHKRFIKNEYVMVTNVGSSNYQIIAQYV